MDLIGTCFADKQILSTVNVIERLEVILNEALRYIRCLALA
jgi:hypothetical protein